MKFSLRRGILPKYMEFIDEHVFPTIVIGDEHCLLRSGSALAFGDESCHIEIRFIMELVIHENIYTDCRFFRRVLVVG